MSLLNKYYRKILMEKSAKYRIIRAERKNAFEKFREVCKERRVHSSKHSSCHDHRVGNRFLRLPCSIQNCPIAKGR